MIEGFEREEGIKVEKFIENLYSPYWWISVVLMGLLLGVVANYIKSGIDYILISFWEKYRGKSKKRKNLDLLISHIIKSEPHSQITTGIGLINRGIISVFWLVFSLGILFLIFLMWNIPEITNQYYALYIGFVVFFAGIMACIRNYFKAERLRRIFTESLKPAEEEEKEEGNP